MIEKNCTYLLELQVSSDLKWLPLIIVKNISLRKRVGEHDEASYQGKMAIVDIWKGR